MKRPLAVERHARKELHRAICETLERRTLLAVQILNSTFEYDEFKTPTSPPHKIIVQFSADVSVSLSASDLRLDVLTGESPTGITTDMVWDSGTCTATFRIGGASGSKLPDGNYRGSIAWEDVVNVSHEQLESDVIVDFFVLDGDANHNRVVDVVDNGIVASNWQQSPRRFSQGDFTYNGTVDIADLGILSSNWQKQMPAPPTAPTDLFVGNQSDNTIELNWVDVAPNATGYRIQRAEDGQTFTIYQSIPRSQLTFTGPNNERVTWTDTGLAQGKKYTYRVRAYDNSASGYDTAYTPKKAATTILPAPIHVVASNVAETDDIRVSWSVTSQDHSGFVVRYYLAGQPISPGTLLGSATVGASARDHTFTSLGAGALYQFTVQALGEDTTSAESIPVENRHEPTGAWTNVYDLQHPENAASYVTGVWSPIPGPYENEIVTLTLSNLPRHTYARIGMRLDAFNWQTYDMDLTSDVVGTADDTTLRAGASRYVRETYWYVGIGENPDEFPDAFSHTDRSMTITLDVSGFAEGWYWSVAVAYVETYLPRVGITSVGVESEDRIDDGKFVVSREHPGSATILNTSLTVNLDPPTGTAIEGVDYLALPREVTIPAGELSVDVDLKAIDDDDIEAAEETVVLAIANPPAAPELQYGIIMPMMMAQLGLLDDDFIFKKASFNFDSQGVRQDKGEQDAYPDVEWLDEDVDERDDRGYVSKYGAAGILGVPLRYTRSVNVPFGERYVSANAVFEIVGNVLGELELIAAGSGPGGGISRRTATVTEPDEHGIRVISGSYNVSPPSLLPTTPLPATIKSGSLSINWQLKKRSLVTVEYGTSKNHIYVANANTVFDPWLQLPPFETVLDIACGTSDGMVGPDPDETGDSAKAKITALVDAVFATFAGTSTKDVRGKEMMYWGTISGPPGMQAIQDTAGLLQHNDGRCEAWSSLFVDAVWVHGIGARVVGIEPNAEVVVPGLGQPPPPPPPPPLTKKADAWMEFTAAPAQNSPNPSRTTFPNHAVVKIDDSRMGGTLFTIYDPSYGKSAEGASKEQAEQSWQDQLLKGFRWVQLTEQNHITGMGPIVEHIEGSPKLIFY